MLSLLPRAVFNADATIDATTTLAAIDSSGGPFTLTLPPIAMVAAGSSLWFHDEVGACELNPVQIVPSPGDALGRGEGAKVACAGGMIVVYSDGSAWQVLLP